ncbi:D-alanine--D-alanyl carrier protein ligase [Streptomyces violaceorubidus]
MHPDNAAYVMYTSGSTGVPKGVTITHRNIAACLPSLVAAVGLEPGGRVLAGTSVNFDVSVFEIMTALTTGATVDVVRDVLELGERDDWQGTVVSSVPSVFAELLDRIAGKVRVGTLVFAGEPLPAALVRRARTAFPGVRVVNGYGQTETFYASAHTLRGDQEEADLPGAPIGTPLDGARVRVLGDGLLPVPPGVPGELYVAGGSVARGYHDGGPPAPVWPGTPPGPDAGGLTPSDVPLVDVRQGELERAGALCPRSTDAWPLTPLQHGLLFESMLADTSYDAYHVHVVYARPAPSNRSGCGPPGRRCSTGTPTCAPPSCRTGGPAGAVGARRGRTALAPRRPAGRPTTPRAAEALRRLLAEDEAGPLRPGPAPAAADHPRRCPARTEAQLALTSHHALLARLAAERPDGRTAAAVRLRGRPLRPAAGPPVRRLPALAVGSRTRRPPTGPGGPSWPGWRSRRWS